MQQSRLNDGQVTDSSAAHQRGRQSGIIIHRQMGLKTQRLLLFAAGAHEKPTVIQLPVREGEQTMMQQITGMFRRLTLRKIAPGWPQADGDKSEWGARPAMSP